MLMSSQALRYAHQLLDARAQSKVIPRISESEPLSVEDAYEIAHNIRNIRVAQGEQPIGRKIGFVVRKNWERYGIIDDARIPTWAPMYDTTVRFAEDNHGLQSLTGAVQPRIEPEIVFKLGKTPAPNASLEELADCLEWMAHGFEIVVCPFPKWEFTVADSIAAFGLHGTLIVGEPHVLSSASRHHLPQILASASVSLSCSTESASVLRAAGFCNDEMDSPLHALWHLHQLLQKQTRFRKLQAGEIITTGTWTDACPIEPGQTWTTAFSGVTLPGLTVSFV
ncbi:2-keto-4-pentenoate hydratase [Herbaspirillum seropedicae]|uniref:4-oxalocrotonate decarboxylase protein n=1 Tax=Herbaspirillum seropedicae (strain SmR1) TaxID=757424 RepID=D8IX73_HERSS|nr:fumarylacetoacetate hydrolase family protein [Herbaspirillum seropedicae]ADJ61948.1 4-oxalocrotonate decarboxylase protein [Herbaspirillum seropedicae SmR1]AKN64131.1 4-oxalocrotonate decarboxylase [Herbaspirillum seropedicae]NQE29517.1 4-oxalocrotonate decarboxylase [Herbaspirillum seropedicae]